MIKQNNGKLMLRRIMPLIKGGAAGLCALVLLAPLSALCCYAAGAPEGTDVILSYIAAGGAALTGGMFCAAAHGRDGLLWGAFAGLELFAVLFLGALTAGNLDGTAALWKLLLCAVCSAAGGVIGVNKFAKQR